MDEIADAIERVRRDPEAETRGFWATWLGEHGDARAFEVLVAATSDDGTWYEEGAFADNLESVADNARAALRALAARIEPPPDVAASVRRLLPRDVDRTASAMVSEDEDVRFAVTQEDAYTPGLYYNAMKRYPHEPSARVRRGIAGLWIRMANRMAGKLRTSDIDRFFADDDAEVRRVIANHVLAKLADVERAHRLDIEVRARKALGKATSLDEDILRAHADGKEPFDWERFRMSGCRPHGEEEHRRDYYVMQSDIRTMADYIAHRKEMDPWD